MKKLMSKEIKFKLWEVVLAVLTLVGMVGGCIASDMVVVTPLFVEFITITAQIVGNITLVTVVLALIYLAFLYRDKVGAWFNKYAHIILIVGIIALILIIVFGITHQVKIGAMPVEAIITMMKVGITAGILLGSLAILWLVYFFISNFIETKRRFQRVRRNKKKVSRMHKQQYILRNLREHQDTEREGSLANRTNVAVLYTVSMTGDIRVQDVEAEDILGNKLELKALYNAKIFEKLANVSIGGETPEIERFVKFHNTLDQLLKLKMITKREAATAKVASIRISDENLALLLS